MAESDWVVQVLENDNAARGEPSLGLVATRAPFDVDQGAGPVLAAVRTGSDRDRILIDLRSDSPRWTLGLGGPPGSTPEPWLGIGAEDLPEDSSKVRIFRFEVDWEAAVVGPGQDVACIVAWRKDPDTLRDLWAPPDDPDGPELLSFLSKRFPVFISAEERGGGGTRGGSNMLCMAVGLSTAREA
jgi:hypothetical protein